MSHRCILSLLACSLLAVPLAGQEVVTYWNGYEWLEGEVAQELWVRPNYQAGAEALLAATGNGDFTFDGINTCGLDAMIFKRNDASATPVPSGTPVLEISRRLGFEAPQSLHLVHRGRRGRSNRAVLRVVRRRRFDRAGPGPAR